MAAEHTVLEDLDDAKKRLRSQGQTAAQAVEKSARRPASYHVFRLEAGETAGEDCPLWRWLTEKGAVQVVSLGRDETKKREAIKAASDSLTPDELNGTFVAVKEGEWFPILRRVEQRLEDIFE